MSNLDKMMVVHLAELGLNVLLGKDGQVLVHDLATECFFSVEMADYVLRILCHIEKFLMEIYFKECSSTESENDG